MRKLIIRPTVWVLGLYLGFTAVVMPILALQRVLGLGEPAEFRNVVLPMLLLLMVLGFGALKVVKLRTWLQALLAFGFVQAMLMGLLSGQHDEETRNYLSHLFQLGSAYLMTGVGWLSVQRFSREFWRNWVFLSLVAITISTALTIGALERGDIGRLYTPAYGLILVMAYAAVFSRSGVIASFLLVLVSNKRAIFLGLGVQALYEWCRNVLMTRGVRYTVWAIASATVLTFIIVVAAWFVVSWAENKSADNGVALAINISVDRLERSLNIFSEQESLSSISAGRDIEVTSALEQSRWWYWVAGGGAGWAVDIGERYVHNIHLSPLSIALVFGTPFALLLYGTLGWMLVRSFRNGLRSNDATSLIAPLYLTGALVHSFFAYSLFVDLLVFFFAGVMARNLAVAGSRGRTTAS